MTTYDKNIKYMVDVYSSLDFIDRARIATRRLLKSNPFPSFTVINDNKKDCTRWAIYFCYNPDGRLLPQNEFMINRLKQDGFGIIVILACKCPTTIDARFKRLSDVLIWKDMQGFDMSALRIGLAYVLETRGEVSAVWINDSVFGPFNTLSHFFEKYGKDFDVLGLTLSYAIRPHIQSYCILFQKLTKNMIRGLFGAEGKSSFEDHLSNVLVFEACFAANLVSAGFRVKCWAAPELPNFDLTMAYPFELVENGFPFIKRSLVGKFSTAFDQNSVKGFLEARNFPYQLS